MVGAMIASKRLFPASKLLERLLVTPIRSITAARSPSSASRSINTSSQRHDDKTRSDKPTFPGFFSDLSSKWLQHKKTARDLALSARSRFSYERIVDSLMSYFSMKFDLLGMDNDAVYLRKGMPGLSKENVKVIKVWVEVSVEKGTVVITGVGGKGSGDEETYCGCDQLGLPPKLYKLDEIRAKLKNGVLEVVPKVKIGDDEEEDVFKVTKLN